MKAALPMLSILAACVAADTTRATPYGSYDCDVMRFSLTPKVYTIDGQSRAVARTDTLPDGLSITLADGYSFALSNIVPQGVDWASPASGDRFRCARL